MKSRHLLVASVLLNVALAVAVFFYLQSSPSATPVPDSPLSTSKPANPLSTSFSSAISPSHTAGLTAHRTPSAPLSSPEPAPLPPVKESRFPAPQAADAVVAASSYASDSQTFSGGVSIDPAQRGNSFSRRGMRVSVTSNFGTVRGGQPVMAVEVSPESPASSPSTSAAETSSGAETASFASASAVAETAAAEESSSIAKTHASSHSEVASSGNEETADLSSKDVYIQLKSRLGTFTPEEELFRTRWGWAAYDMAQREADRTANTGSH